MSVRSSAIAGIFDPIARWSIRVANRLGVKWVWSRADENAPR